ncbi:hypothetical protein BP6252_02240 [Coleophoma cylindrospora]|uniref:Hard-surface induced protein 5 n=1 Tax=Coleophoma cylindrospora TaxID=1849047 RepID=A0A3D8SE88_9HELO|nr:hypothetical protein BP6252_02240 [Coleophoma cylindrospora]
MIRTASSSKACRLSTRAIVLVIILLIVIDVWYGKLVVPGASKANKWAHQLHVGPRLSFYEIADKHGADKVGKHHYQDMYEERLGPLRDKPIKMLEIGLGCHMEYGPGPSYYTWLEYFSDVELYFIDYDIECASTWANLTKGATIITGDQADISFLKQFLQHTGGQFDIIIDDGGHTMAQQRTSLNILWDALRPGGTYFIEDLGTSYLPQYGGFSVAAGEPRQKPETIMEDVKTLLDDMNKPAGTQPKNRISEDVMKLDFVQELVALTKRDPEREFLD